MSELVDQQFHAQHEVRKGKKGGGHKAKTKAARTEGDRICRQENAFIKGKEN